MERVSLPAITPFEVWDLKVDGALLGDFYGAPAFSAALCRAIRLLRERRGETDSTGSVPAVVAGFDAVLIAGGRVVDAELREQRSGLPCPLFFGEAGFHAGAAGGFELLRRRGLAGWVVDLGQSQLKIAAPDRRWVFPRDWDRLSMPTDTSSSEWPAQRRRLREFIALRLQRVMAETGSLPSAAVIALPTRVAADGTPDRSSYAGMAGDRALLPDAMRMAGLTGVPLFVLNDAELAAWSALVDSRLGGFRKVLVLTLGFGIGAALIQRNPEESRSE